MEFRVLGPVEVRRDDLVAGLPGRLQRILLGVLLDRANRSVSVDVLTDALWGARPDPRSAQKLHLQIHRLRSALGEPDRLAFGPQGYQLRVLPGELDADRFESLADEGTELAGQDPQRAVEVLREALGLWRGGPFGDMDVPVLGDWMHRLVERRLVAVEALYQAELDCGLNAALIGALADLVREYPLRERLHGMLMLALYRAGRQAEALAAYRTARDTIIEELGLEPGPELRELEQRIRAGESLEPEPLAMPAAAVPAQLPVDVRGFVGRDSELDELDGLLAAEPSVAIAAVAGTAGVGKTALAVRWAHRVRARFPDGQLYVDLRGFGPDQPVSPDDALAGFLRALGLDGAAIPQEPAERAARFRTLVDQHRMLIVLDNACTVEQVRPLLPGSSSCFTLVTSRITLAGLVAREGAHPVYLDRLSDPDARGVLRELLGDRIDAEPSATDALVKRCARLPLALRITAELIRSQPARTLSDLAEELADQQDALDFLDVDCDPQTAVRAVFSWSYERLDTEVARMFRLFGVHPGHDMDTYAAAAMAGCGAPEARRTLEVLRRAHLLDGSSGGRYQPHDLLRAYAAELAVATDSVSEREAALTRICDHYLFTASTAMDILAPHDYDPRPKVSTPGGETPPFSEYEHAARWLGAERANLLAATRHGVPRFVIHLSETVWRYLDTGGYHDDALTLHARALDAALTLGDSLAEANARRMLGVAMIRTGMNRGLINHLQRALVIYEQAEEHVLEAATLNCLGCVYGRRDELEPARTQFERVLALTEQIDAGFLRIAVSLNLSDLMRRLGRFEEARGHAEYAIARCQEEGHTSTLPHALGRLAEAYVDFGLDEPAGEHARRGLALARETGYRTVEGDCLRVLGIVLRNRGEVELALRHHHDALEIARAVGESNLIVNVLNSAAATHASAGRPAEALRLYGEAVAIAAEADHREKGAHAHAGIGDVRAALGKPDKAREHWEKALTIYRELGVPAATEIAAKLNGLARPDRA